MRLGSLVMEYKLSDLLNIKYGKSQKRVENPDGNYPIIGTGGVMGFSSEYLYNQPSVLIGRKGSIQNIYFIDEPFWTIDTLFYTEINKEIVNPKFIYYKLKNIDMTQFDEGTSVPSLRTATLNEIILDIPSKTTQFKTVQVLNSIDKKIEINNKIIENLEAQAQAIFKSWFVDFEPFQDGNFVENELGLIPEGWEVAKLKDLSSVVTGKTPSTKIKEYYGDDFPFITIPDMHNKTYITSTERYLSEKGRDSQVKKTIPKDSICVSCIATVGLVVITSEDSQTNQQINSLIPNDKKYLYYLYLLLESKYGYLNAIGSSGSTTKNINKRTFESISILKPNYEIISRFYDICKPIFNSILNYQTQNGKLAQTRDTLLPNLMSGEIDVSKIKIDDEDIDYE